MHCYFGWCELRFKDYDNESHESCHVAANKVGDILSGCCNVSKLFGPHLAISGMEWIGSGRTNVIVAYSNCNSSPSKTPSDYGPYPGVNGDCQGWSLIIYSLNLGWCFITLSIVLSIVRCKNVPSQTIPSRIVDEVLSMFFLGIINYEFWGERLNYDNSTYALYLWNALLVDSYVDLVELFKYFASLQNWYPTPITV